MDEFLGKARALAGNPLGIVALFIALIYGFATLLLGSTADKLTPAEREPLVWFVVLFPVLVLAVFYVLVARHHWKLYAPGDYKNDDSFLKALTPDQRAARLDEEIAALQAVPETTIPAEATKSVVDATSPQEREVAVPSAADLRTMFSRVERLALDKLRRDRKLSIQTEIAVGDQPSVAFDGVAETDSEFIAIEIKLLRASWIPADRLREIFYRGVLVQEFLRRRRSPKKVRLILVFVVQQDEVERHRFDLLMRAVLKDAPIDVDWEILSLSQLESLGRGEA